jgi:hypothetical protein
VITVEFDPSSRAMLVSDGELAFAMLESSYKAGWEVFIHRLSEALKCLEEAKHG